MALETIFCQTLFFFSMNKKYIVNDDNIGSYSRSWNQREQISEISILMDSILKQIEEFSILYYAFYKYVDETMNQSLSRLESRMDSVESKIKYFCYIWNRME